MMPSGDIGDVEQQHRSAVVEQGRSGVKPRLHHRRRKRFDHQIAVIVDPLDREREQVAAGKAEHHQRRLLGRFVVRQPEHLAQHQAGHAHAPEGDQCGLAQPGKVERAGRALHDFLDIALRDRETLPARLDRQPGDDAERQRDLEREGGALAGDARDLDRAADFLEVLAHHIKTHAAPGDVADGLGGGESGFEDEVQDLVARHGGALGGGDEAGGDGLGGDPFLVQPAPVVGEHDRDRIARLPRGNRQQSDLALALLQARVRRFDPVVDGIADDVGERIADRLDHLAVEFDIAAVKIDHHLLAEFGAEVAHKPGEGTEQGLDPLHPHPRDRVAHVGEDGGEALERAIDGRLVARLPQPVGEIVAGEHHVGDAAHHAVEQFHGQADGALGGSIGAPRRRGGFLARARFEQRFGGGVQGVRSRDVIAIPLRVRCHVVGCFT